MKNGKTILCKENCNFMIKILIQKILPFFFIFFISCYNEPINSLVVISGETQGTTYNIQYLIEDCKGCSDDQQKIYKTEIEKVLSLVDETFSLWNMHSDLTRINDGEKIKVNSMFKAVFSAAEEIYNETDGMYDCSIAPLTHYWGFTGDYEKLDNADTSEIYRRLMLVNYSKLKIIDDSIQLPDGMQLDYNSLVQGYSVDLISEIFLKNNVFNFLVEIGGEIRAYGKNIDGESWIVGIDKPNEKLDLKNRFQVLLSLDNMSLATSGNYRKFRELNGIKYSHTINPNTGYFANNKMLSATVIHESCMLADAYATAFMSMGIQESIAYCKNNQEVKSYFVYSDDKGNWKVYSSPNLKILE
ncbi:MAG: hypothetical protein CMP51_01410 [Flavobacteriales bacterium]|nr:hypothetical protein [Flavobacteriales bacterium]